MNSLKQLNIVFFGTPDFVIPVIESLLQNFNVIGVVTASDKPVGREQKLTQTPVKEYASLHQIKILTPEKLDNQTALEIKNLKPDIFVVAAFGKIIPPKILEIPKFGALNIHPSLLPKYRGPSPIQSSILNGDTISGVSIMKMDKQMDHGPLVYTKDIGLSDQDTFESLSKNMFAVSAEVLPDIIRQFIEGKIEPVVQDEKSATFTKIITKEDGYFDISSPPSPKILDRMIRAYYPWPGVWTRWQEKIVKFYPNCLIQMEGKNPVPLTDFLHGYPDFPIKELN
jgi:methionyl-tRNA formyltransferase